MIRGLVTASLLALSDALTDNDITVLRAGDICAAGPKKKDMGPVLYVGMAGNKNCTNLATVPDEHIRMYTLGSSLISNTDPNATKYMNDSNLVTKLDLSGDGYFEEPTMEPASVSNKSTPQYGFFSFGSDVGNTSSDTYGYVGMAAYVMVQGELSFQNNTFRVKSDDKEICAVPKEAAGADTACGAAQKVQAGDIKYSLFGYGAGSGINTSFVNNSFWMFRSKIVYSTMGTGASVTFNDNNLTAAAIGTTQIKSFKVKGNQTALSIDFPQWYNYGITEGGVHKKKGSAQVKIRHVASNTSGEFYIDYLFAKSADGIGKDKGWFVYDPTVANAGPKPTPAPTPAATPAPTPKSNTSNATNTTNNTTKGTSNTTNNGTTNNNNNNNLISGAEYRTMSFALLVAILCMHF
eukprot:TRINITY_DN4958_c0_g1_i1.p1 TRINITY_DN4958_c0_g1~~TRINITY_DN4958_c0_g1_i1.p1  ORF type:complete len:407 (-),score=73.23 TRINITY_DN4958_c0_g1_i1:295-1515(-)